MVLTASSERSAKRRFNVASVAVALAALWATHVIGRGSPGAVWSQSVLSTVVMTLAGESLRNGLWSLIVERRAVRAGILSAASLLAYAAGCLAAVCGELGLSLPAAAAAAPHLLTGSATAIGAHHLAREFDPAPLTPAPRAVTIAVTTALLSCVAAAWFMAGPETAPAALLLVLGVVAATPCWLTTAEPPASSDAADHNLADINSVVLEKSEVVTSGHCEIEAILPIAPEATDEEVVHLAAVSEYVLPPHPIRDAILRHTQGGFTVPSIKKHQHSPGRGVAAQLAGKDLRFGNVEWMRESGWSDDELTQALEITRDQYEKGRSVLYVGFRGKIVGAVCLREELRPGIEEFVATLQAIGVEVGITSGDSPTTVAALLPEFRDIRVFAGLHPDGRLDALKELARQRKDVALIAKQNSPISRRATEIGAVFELRQNGDVYRLKRASSPPQRCGKNLAHVATLLQDAKRERDRKRRRRVFAAAHNFVIVPGAFGAAAALLGSWSWPLVGSLLGVGSAAVMHRVHAQTATPGDQQKPPEMTTREAPQADSLKLEAYSEPIGPR